jgi:hypothetical protein
LTEEGGADSTDGECGHGRVYCECVSAVGARGDVELMTTTTTTTVEDLIAFLRALWTGAAAAADDDGGVSMITEQKWRKDSELKRALRLEPPLLSAIPIEEIQRMSQMRRFLMLWCIA